MCDERDPLAGLLVRTEGFRDGRPCVAGTGITVHAIAAAHLNGFSAEDILDDFPRAGRAGVYAALAYYFANTAELEADWTSDEEFWKKAAVELHATVV